MLNTRTHNDQLLPTRHRRSSDHRGAGGAGGEQRHLGLRHQRQRHLHLQALWRGHAVEDTLVSPQVQGKIVNTVPGYCCLMLIYTGAQCLLVPLREM